MTTASAENLTDGRPAKISRALLLLQIHGLGDCELAKRMDIFDDVTRSRRPRVEDERSSMCRMKKKLETVAGQESEKQKIYSRIITTGWTSPGVIFGVREEDSIR
ncbi:hypothetical protein K3495_g10258 [Podosphaera aphanis]|nr:hypothetical protein K3495_g10258 [Podosphaera aphanis]